MTISNIGPSMTFAEPGVGLDAEGRLALLILENQDARHQASSEDKAIARGRFLAASHEEVAAMHEEAHDILVGAFAQAAASVAAAAIQVGDVLDEPKCDAQKEKPWGEIGAATLNALSQPIGKYLGDSPAANDRAEAKRAGTLAQQATWQLDDATDAMHKSEQRQEKAMDWLASETADRASTESGIIAGFA
jgi:hypothetical protein